MRRGLAGYNYIRAYAHNDIYGARGGRTRSRAIVISTSISTARLRGQCKVHEKPLTTVVTWERFLARAPPMDFV